MQKAVVEADWICSAPSPQELLAGRPEQLRLAPDDFKSLEGDGDIESRATELQVTLIVSPKHFGSRVSLPEDASAASRP